MIEGFEITGGHAAAASSTSRTTSRCATSSSTTAPPTGILGADWGSGSLTVEHSEVYRCGGGDRLHQIYTSADQDNYPDSVFRLQYSWIHDANGGNNVKSRAARNEIYYNRIEGAYYHELELIGAECCAESVVREDSDVVGNLLVKKGAERDFPVVAVRRRRHRPDLGPLPLRQQHGDRLRDGRRLPPLRRPRERRDAQQRLLPQRRRR